MKINIIGMHKNIIHLNFLYLTAFLVITGSCSRHKISGNVSYGEATQELVKLVDSDPGLKSLLISSIEKARQINPDSNSNPVQSLTRFYEIVSRAETSVPWDVIKTGQHLSPFENIFRMFCVIYFVIDQPLPELEGRGYFHNSLQYAEPFASWLTVFNKSWRSYLDSTASWNDNYYKMMLQDSAFGLQNGWYEDPSHWKSFNQFFARQLSSPAARPIAFPDDNSIVISFADAEPQGVWAIDSSSNIMDKAGVAIKSATIRSVQKLLGEDSPYKNAFVNGTFTHSFLNVNDYHRYHFPLGGTVKEVRIIQGINPTGGELTWDNEGKRYIFNPSRVGWQMLETRGCVIIETEDYGLVALLPIGMAAVGSVNFERAVTVGAKVRKGDMLGYFLFGGSDFIMVFQHNVQFTLDTPRQADGIAYKHLLMGERLGHLSKTKSKIKN
jgi:phosphatidylserine decarboxylase